MWQKVPIPTCRGEGEAQKNIGRKVVVRVQLPHERSPHNWVVYLMILIRENLLYGKRDNWDQNTPSNSPRAPGTTEKYGKEKVHR